MEEKAYFDTNQKIIDQKKHNIIIPVCLGNKFFVADKKVTDNFRYYIDYALKRTKEKVLVLIADKVQDTNYIVRNKNKNEASNKRRVMREGLEVYISAIELIEKKFKSNKDRLLVVRWEDYEKKDLYFEETRIIVYDEFRSNKVFAAHVLETIKTTVLDKSFSESEYLRLCNYILDEFSLCYSGVNYYDIQYDLMIYPNIDTTLYFFQDLKDGKIYKRLTAKLPKKKLAYLIIN
ncbi:MAG: hypothetical protein NTY12_02400 [Candidatus Falkowbacteria bacterium]|nr:hypothetical protein [Candidatus Falkowbacteria bacterium]